jgi:2-oxo-4-hydroxy-4-carboxy-5-ureidoimidazoline decarboxylase
MSAPAARLDLAAVNALDQARFTAALGFAFERSPWVMERAWAKRPFADVAALVAEAGGVLEEASAEARLALIRAHPELAGKAAIAGTLTSESRAEQAGAGLDQLSPAEFARFHELNSAYGAKFQFPFIICVRLSDKASILAAMERRLENDAAAEVAEAIAQILEIGRLRLSDRIAT